MLKFTLTSEGVKSNLNELILAGKLDTNVLVKAVLYQYDLTRWWNYKYNSDQPRQVINILEM